MITSQKPSNKHLYEKLFAKATADLREKKILLEGDPDINTLEQYFCNLKNLLDLDTKYIMLPLDEEPFDIDATSRTITVPANFKKHGISVQGDETAETIFFRIDRFFDAMDFDTCDVYVQWQGNDNVPYVTPINIKDLDSQPGKIIYAWPISSKLTKNVGPIKFSVRFIKADATNLITYSYSTLTTNVTINPGLNFDVFKAKQDRSDDLFKFAIENSTAVSAIPAAKPVFVLDLPTEANIRYPKLYLEVKEDGTREYKLSVSTKVDDTGAIRYEWFHRKDEEGGKVTKGPGVDRYEPTADTVPDPTKSYYEKESETVYPPYDVTNGFIEDKQAYERFNDLILSGKDTVKFEDDASLTGYYFVTATNRFGYAETSADSAVVLFPTPSKPVIGEGEDIAPGVIGLDNGTLVVKCTVDANSITHFSWKKDMKQDGAFETEVRAYENNFSTTPSDSFAPTEPGYYRVDIDSEINLDAIGVSSSVVRVTNIPAPVVFDENSNADALDVFVNINDTESVVPGLLEVPGADETLLPKDLQTDAITYVWYQDYDAKGVLTDGKIDEDAVALTEPSETPALTVDGSLNGMQLRCVAANSLNGAVTYSSSKLYVFGGHVAE